MYVALWERYFYVVLVEHIVDGSGEFADDVDLAHGIAPAQQLEIDAAVAKSEVPCGSRLSWR